MARTAITIEGMGAFNRRLTRLSRSVKFATEKELGEAANRIKVESQKRAPEKTGALVLAHSVTKKGSGVKTEYSVNVASVLDSKGRNYAVEMHEGIKTSGSFVNPAFPPYVLGQLSSSKSIGMPHRGKGVGIRFLARAAEFVYRDLLRNMASRVSSRVKV